MNLRLVCRGCASSISWQDPSPWACPRRAELTEVDHVLVLSTGERGHLDATNGGPSDAVPATDDQAGNVDSAEENPFLRYRARLGSYQAAREIGWSDQQFVDLVEGIDAELRRTSGTGFLRTPVTSADALGGACGLAPGRLILKDETHNVGGSHKARHLMGIAIWMRLRSECGLEVQRPRLAIASCGNAAIAAATLAAAMKCPLEVFVPEWASAAVVDTLQSLGAKVIRCPREPGELGDPCVRLANAAVASGALPFSCQGTANGLTIDGGRTLGWELAEQVPALGSVFVQVGGGALATAVAAGLAEGGSAAELFVVQAEGCAPLDRAVQRVAERGLRWAMQHRRSVMWPWETEPHSSATGILDDETYDWAGVCESLERLGGQSIVAVEESVVEAQQILRAHTQINADTTGSAGLAGLIEVSRRLGGSDALPQGPIAVLATGIDRTL